MLTFVAVQHLDLPAARLGVATVHPEQITGKDCGLITTGAGDHFNAGFCMAKLLGLDDRTSLLVGTTTSSER